MLGVREIVQVRDPELDAQSNKSPDPLLDGPAISKHMSALLPFKFPTSEKYDALLDSFVTSMHIRAAKSLIDVILHKFYSIATIPKCPRYKIHMSSF